MSSIDQVVASLPDTQLTLAGLLQGLHRMGRLAPLAREILAAQFVQGEARKIGLAVTTEELQAAADTFRRRRGLTAAMETRKWLAAQGLSVDDFETGLEHDLLTFKLQEHLTSSKVDSHFAAHRADFERLRLTLVLSPREDIARELATQVQEGDRNLAAVGLEHGIRPEYLNLFRKDLPGSLAKAIGNIQPGKLIGPVPIQGGFALVVVEERRPAQLESATRQIIQNELFETWLANHMQKATIDFKLAGMTG